MLIIEIHMRGIKMEIKTLDNSKSLSNEKQSI